MKHYLVTSTAYLNMPPDQDNLDIRETWICEAEHQHEAEVKIEELLEAIYPNAGGIYTEATRIQNFEHACEYKHLRRVS